MTALPAITLIVFVALFVNDIVLARRIRRAMAAGRLSSEALAGLRAGGSPLGLVLNLFHLRHLPRADALSDPDHVAACWQYRMQLVLVAALAACLVVVGVEGAAT